MAMQAPTLLSGEEAKKEEDMYLGPALKFDDAELTGLRAEVDNIGQVIEGTVVRPHSSQTLNGIKYYRFWNCAMHIRMFSSEVDIWSKFVLYTRVPTLCATHEKVEKKAWSRSSAVPDRYWGTTFQPAAGIKAASRHVCVVHRDGLFRVGHQ